MSDNNEIDTNASVLDNDDLEGMEVVTIAQLEKRNPKAFDLLKKWDKDAHVYYYAEDKTIRGDFDLDMYDTPGIFMGFVFGKNLIVENDLVQMEGDYGTYLFVTGNLTANNIDKGGSYMEIAGDCTVKGMIYGYYNHGELIVHGSTRARYIIQNDHFFTFHKLDEDIYEEYIEEYLNIYQCDYEKLFIPELIREYPHIDTEKARNLLSQGKDILRKNWELADRDEDEEVDETSEDCENPESEDAGLVIEACDFEDDVYESVFGLAVQGSHVLAVGGQEDPLMGYSEDGCLFTPIGLECPGLRAACFVQKDIWIAGEYGFVAKSSDNGSSWKVIDTGFDGCLFGIAADDQGKLWITGEKGYLAALSSNSRFIPQLNLHENLGRISPSPIGLLVPATQSGDLFIIHGGTVKKTQVAKNVPLMEVKATLTGTLLAVGPGGSIFRSADQGATFAKIETGVSEMFTSLGQLPQGLIIVFGENGLMMASMDDGESFTPLGQDVCTETVWSCQQCHGALIFGAEDGLIYRICQTATPD